jgi:hypothetical protein
LPQWTAWYYTPEAITLHNYSCENFKTYVHVIVTKIWVSWCALIDMGGWYFSTFLTELD